MIVSVNFSPAVFSCLSTHDSLVMQGFVWLHTVRIRVIQFGTSYTNLRWPHICKHQIWRKNLIFHSSKYDSREPDRMPYNHPYTFTHICMNFSVLTSFLQLHSNGTTSFLLQMIQIFFLWEFKVYFLLHQSYSKVINIIN